MTNQPTEMTDPFAKIAAGLIKAVSTPTDELAARKGEGDLLVKIKRNSDRTEACDRHEFEPCTDWRTAKGPFLWLKVRCTRCGGEMKADAALTYLRGFAHGSGQNYDALANAVFPPGKPKETDNVTT